MSHRGSILATAAGISAWRPDDVAAIAADDLRPLRESPEPIDIFILGSGRSMIFPSKEIRSLLAEICRSVEVMNTGTAISTYNILLAEARRVAAGLIAVDHAR
ncbi:MAG: Mth938-like domain-containing protein [Rhizobiales bacterium]|nr:Mth938-like domain-containing protein [Hyphomicrobiales bacterium]